MVPVTDPSSSGMLRQTAPPSPLLPQVTEKTSSAMLGGAEGSCWKSAWKVGQSVQHLGKSHGKIMENLGKSMEKTWKTWENPMEKLWKTWENPWTTWENPVDNWKIRWNKNQGFCWMMDLFWRKHRWIFVVWRVVYRFNHEEYDEETGFNISTSNTPNDGSGWFKLALNNIIVELYSITVFKL